MEIYENWVVPIYEQNHSSPFTLLGIGFVVSHNQKMYLVSSFHVIEHSNGRQLSILMGGKMISLGRVLFAVSKVTDVAATHIRPEVFSMPSAQHDKLPRNALSNRYTKKSKGQFFMIGVQAPEIIAFGVDSASAEQIALGLGAPKSIVLSTTTIDSPIGFDYVSQAFSKLKEQKLTHSEINNLNGCPLLTGPNKDTLECSVLGVFVESDKSTKEFIFASLDAILAVIHSVRRS